MARQRVPRRLSRPIHLTSVQYRHCPLIAQIHMRFTAASEDNSSGSVMTVDRQELHVEMFAGRIHRVSLAGRKPGAKCGGRPVQGVWGQKSSSGIQGRSPGRASVGRSPPEAETILDFYKKKLDRILNYFCVALQILGDVSPRPQGLRFWSLDRQTHATARLSDSVSE